MKDITRKELVKYISDFLKNNSDEYDEIEVSITIDKKDLLTGSKIESTKRANIYGKISEKE